MSKIAAWLVKPGSEPEAITFEYTDGILGEVSRKYFDGEGLDLTKVRYQGRLCHMAVDDEGLLKQLPVNEIATKAYWANCRPGTTHPIVGTAVIFGGLLP